MDTAGHCCGVSKVPNMFAERINYSFVNHDTPLHFNMSLHQSHCRGPLIRWWLYFNLWHVRASLLLLSVNTTISSFELYAMRHVVYATILMEFIVSEPQWKIPSWPRPHIMFLVAESFQCPEPQRQFPPWPCISPCIYKAPCSSGFVVLRYH